MTGPIPDRSTGSRDSTHDWGRRRKSALMLRRRCVRSDHSRSGTHQRSMLHNAAILLIRDGVQVDLGLYNCW